MEMLAAKMRDLGHKWTKITVHNIETGDRQLRMKEAVDLAECVGSRRGFGRKKSRDLPERCCDESRACGGCAGKTHIPTWRPHTAQCKREAT